MPIEEVRFTQPGPGAGRTFELDAMAPWLAMAAIGIGVAGIMREMSRRRAACDPYRAGLVPDDHAFTPPHGDKLHKQV